MAMAAYYGAFFNSFMDLAERELYRILIEMFLRTFFIRPPLIKGIQSKTHVEA